MKLSVSLSDEDIEVLDTYVERVGLPSRSAGLQRAIRMLRHAALEDEYAQAWTEWSDDAENSVWDRGLGDGLTDAAR
jgi:Arc/MetJ-type ribon-helix-helix transcriptional regulator